MSSPPAFNSKSKHKSFFSSNPTQPSSYFGAISPKPEPFRPQSNASAHFNTQKRFAAFSNNGSTGASGGSLSVGAGMGVSIPAAHMSTHIGSNAPSSNSSTKSSRIYSFVLSLVILAQIAYMSVLLLRFKRSGYQADTIDDRDLLMEISWQHALKIYLVAYWVFYGLYFGAETIGRYLFGRKRGGMQGMGSLEQESRVTKGAVNSLFTSIRKDWVHRVYLVVSSVSHFMSALLIIHRIRLRQRDDINSVNVHFMLRETFFLFTSSLIFDIIMPLVLQTLYWKWRIASTEEELRSPHVSKRAIKGASSALHLYKAQYNSFVSRSSSRLILIGRILVDYLNLMGCYLFVYYTGHLEPGSIMKKMATGLCVFYHVSFGPLFFLYATNSFMRIHEWYAPSEDGALLPKRVEDVYKKYVVYLSIMLLSRNFISVCIDVPFLIFKTLHSSYVYIDVISSVCMGLTVLMVGILFIFFWLPFLVGLGSIFCCCCDFLDWRCFRRVEWIKLANAALPITAVPSDILPEGSASTLRED